MRLARLGGICFLFAIEQAVNTYIKGANRVTLSTLPHSCTPDLLFTFSQYLNPVGASCLVDTILERNRDQIMYLTAKTST